MTASPILWFERSGASWIDGLPVGNGRTGAMIYGPFDDQIIALNDETFWSPGPRDRDLTGAHDAMVDVRRLLAEGDVLGAQARALTMLGTPILGAAYQPIGDLVLATENIDATAPQRRSLNLQTGVADFRWVTTAGAEIVRSIVASREPSVFIVSQRGESMPTRVQLRSPFGTDIDGGTMLHGTWSEVAPNRTLAASSYRLTHFDEGQHLRFTVGIRVLEGESESDSDGLRLTSSAWSIAIAVATDFDGTDPADLVERALASAGDLTPQQLVARAIETHQSVFDRASVTLDLSDPARDVVTSLPTDSRVHLVRAGGIDDDLVMLFADYGRYLMIASSVGGVFPPNLQGVWNEDTEPAWCSDWTTNINAQMNLWSADPFQVWEAVDTLANLVEKVAEAGRTTAQEIYGSTGWVVHHNTDIWFNTAPTTMVEVGIFPGAGLWLVQQLWQHHVAYPERRIDERITPLVPGMMEFLESWLVVDADGYLVPSPSSTPENAYLLGDRPRPRSRAVDPDYSVHGWLGEAPTIDLWLIRDTLDMAITMGARVGTDEDRTRWAAIREQLRPIPVIDGEVPEWAWDYRALELGHRHLSPLYGIHPGTFDGDLTTPIARAARTTMINRQAHVEAASFGWGGWSRAWAGSMWARLGDGDRALASLESLLRTGAAPESLLHVFPEFDGHPGEDGVHQIDANMGVPAAIAEMLLQSSPGRLRVLPACPARWTSGSVRTLRALGIDVSFTWVDGQVTFLSLLSTIRQSVVVSLGDRDLPIDLPSGQVVAVIS